MDGKELFYPMQESVLTLPNLNGLLIKCQQPRSLVEDQPSTDDLDENGCCYFGRHHSGRWHWEHRRPVGSAHQAATHYLPADVYALPVHTFAP